MTLSRRGFIVRSGATASFLLLSWNQAHAWSWGEKRYETADLPYPVPGQKINPLTAQIFDASVASGDPTATGVILWTRINPRFLDASTDLVVQVARDPSFERLEVEARVERGSLQAIDDYTVKVDLDGLLAPMRSYYYRFLYGNVPSRIGRCRTLPTQDTELASLRLAFFSCQDYTNGYYSAYRDVALRNDVHFVIHLGDFIYESSADGRFQPLPFEDRFIILPSEAAVAMDAADYRSIYRQYRSDPNLQMAMEAHTFMIVPDDHETANDCYWDYENDTLGAPDHTTGKTGSFDARNTLKLASQKSWCEYVPTRVRVNAKTNRPHDFLSIYRDASFGKLAKLFMVDTRTYRSAPPCGMQDLFGRYLPIGCKAFDLPNRTLFGEKQRDWLYQGLHDCDARWPLLANQTFMGRLAVETPKKEVIPLTVDAWDGFTYERAQLAETVHEAGLENFVVLTGDLHTFIASLVKRDYNRKDNWPSDNIVGVEFMTSSVTSSGLIDMLQDKLSKDPNLAWFVRYFSEGLVRVTNPHIIRFNAKDHGYSLLDLTQQHCTWTALAFDKNDKNAVGKQVHKLRQYSGVKALLPA